MMIAGRYDPIGAADQGGMSEVHHFNDTHLDRRVVLKRIMRQHERRLIDELKALLRLRSKHVVQLYDIVSFEYMGNTETGLILEYIDGQDLQPQTFEPDTAHLKTLWQIASGLADIHSAGVIHRDIKENNIRVDQEGVVKIFDFGLARVHGDDNRTRSIIGTLGYMAPELRGDTTIHFGPPVDIYAFAVTALVLLNRAIPTQLDRRIPQPLPQGTIRAHVPEWDHEIADCIEACLSHNPTLRPTSATIRDLLGAHILRDRHKALMVMGETVHELSSEKRDAHLRLRSIGSLQISYNGLRFFVSGTSGEAFINGGAAVNGAVMPSTCVIAFGASARPAYERAFLTFDISNPEVLP